MKLKKVISAIKLYLEVLLLLFSLSVVSDSFETLWTVAHQAPLSMGFSRQEYWNGLPFPSPGDLPNPVIKPWSLELQTNDQSSLDTDLIRKESDCNCVYSRCWI